MSKQKRRHKRRPTGARRQRQPPAALRLLAAAYEEAERLLDAGEPDAALELLEPLLADHPRVGDLYLRIGYARVGVGDDWGAVDALEQAAKLTGNPDAWIDFALLCLKLLLNATALYALRRASTLDPASARLLEFAEVMKDLQREVRAIARRFGVSDQRAERGLRAAHDGDRALQRYDLRASIQASRRATGLLPGYPPPLNNLSLALFLAGQPLEAIETTERVLSQHPDDIYALSHLIRLLVWTGREQEAREPWLRLQDRSTPHAALQFQIAQTAAVMADDERVSSALEPHKDTTPEDPEWSQEAQLFLATADANLGRHSEALDRLRNLGLRGPRIQAFILALEAGRPGIGWAERFPYFGPTDLIHPEQFMELEEIGALDPDMQSDRARKRIARFVERYPQIVRAVEKIIWEQQLPQAGVPLLAAIGTPEAYAALRRFGLSQAGPDDERLDALTHLYEAGEIAEGERYHAFLGGEWRDVELTLVLGGTGPDSDYAPEVQALLAAAEAALRDEELGKAERLLRKVLELEPEAKEAYNNLAAICLQREDVAQAAALLEAALRIDPMYAFPRGSLATLRLQDDDLAGAKTLLAPLAERRGLGELEEAFYRFVAAQVALREENCAAARAHLSAALNAIPEYEPALRLLDTLDEFEQDRSRYELYMEGEQERRRRRRAQLQGALTTSSPRLREALSVHTKASLTAMARLTPIRPGWSRLRKAKLLEEVERALSDEVALKRYVRFLPDDEIAALGAVLRRGGSMDWDEFEARFGSDLDEYPYWEYQTPATTMGRLRCRGLLAEATVDGVLLVTIPLEARPILERWLPDPSLMDGEWS